MPEFKYNAANSSYEINGKSIETAYSFGTGADLETFLGLGTTYQKIVLTQDITITNAVTFPTGTIIEGDVPTRKLTFNYNSAITATLNAGVTFRNLVIECTTQDSYAANLYYMTTNFSVHFDGVNFQLNSAGTIPTNIRGFIYLGNTACSSSTFNKVVFKLLPAITANYTYQVCIGQAGVALSNMTFNDITISGFTADVTASFNTYLINLSYLTKSKITNINSTYNLSGCDATHAIINFSNSSYNVIDNLVNVAINGDAIMSVNFDNLNGCSCYFVTSITACNFGKIISQSSNNPITITGDSTSNMNRVNIGEVCLYGSAGVFKNAAISLIQVVPNGSLSLNSCYVDVINNNQRTITLTVAYSIINKIINPTANSATLSLESGSANSIINYIRDHDTITLSALTNMIFNNIEGINIACNLSGNSTYSNIKFYNVLTSGATGLTLNLSNPRTGVYVDISNWWMENVTKLTTNGISHNVSNINFKNVNFYFSSATNIIEPTNAIFEQCTFNTTSGTTLTIDTCAKDIKFYNLTFSTFVACDIYGTNIVFENIITNGCKIKYQKGFDIGAATGGAATTLSNAGANWVDDYYNTGFYIYVVKTIIANSEGIDITDTALTTITTGGWTGSNPAAGNIYGIIKYKHANLIPFGTASAGANTTITDASKTWAINGFVNNTIRIIGGTGAGQSRIITGNTATILTVNTQWQTNPDNTSRYVIGSNATNCQLINIDNSSYSAITDNYYFGNNNQIINCQYGRNDGTGSSFTLTGENVELKNCTFYGAVVLNNSNYLTLNNCNIVGNITLDNVSNYIKVLNSYLTGNLTLTTAKVINYLIIDNFNMTGALDIETGTNIKISNSNIIGATTLDAGSYIYINNSYFNGDFTIDDAQNVYLIGCTVLGTIGEGGSPTYIDFFISNCYVNVVNIPTATTKSFVTCGRVVTATSYGGAVTANITTGA